MMQMKNRTWMLLLTLLLYGCGSSNEPVTEGEKTSAAASIKEVNPAIVVAGKPFHPNPKGVSAIGVYGANFTPNSRIRIGAQVLATEVHKGGASATALVPDPLHATPGRYDVVVIDEASGKVSNSLVFTVLAPTGPAPVIDRLYPASTIAGRGFNIQPAGESAIAVTGSNFIPGIKILFGTKELETVYGNMNSLSAWVPAALFATPGTTEVKVRNPDGKLSQPRPFLVTAQK